ncbi:unnamed protein product, partial [Mycena citricolor]
ALSSNDVPHFRLQHDRRRGCDGLCRTDQGQKWSVGMNCMLEYAQFISIVLITGTSLNSLGFETARVVAKYANLVIITGYNTERLGLAQAELQKAGPHAEIRPLVIDLASLKDVRRAAAEVNAYAEPIHVLVNNAAAAVGDFKLSPEGYENQLATDHL